MKLTSSSTGAAVSFKHRITTLQLPFGRIPKVTALVTFGLSRPKGPLLSAGKSLLSVKKKGAGGGGGAKEKERPK